MQSTQPDTVEIVGILVGIVLGLWGAGLSTYQLLRARRPRLTVAADFGTMQVGRIRDHGCFLVSMHNQRERQVTVTQIEWNAPTSRIVIRDWQRSDRPRLPFVLGDNEQQSIAFDPGHAANSIVNSGVRSITVYTAGEHSFTATLSPSAIEEAGDEMERMREADEANSR